MVWVQEDPGTELSTTGRIWVKSLSTGKTFAISKAPGLQTFPDISGDVVVWADTRNTCPTCSRDIYGYRLSTGQEFPIAVGGGDHNEPAISGFIVVWNEVDEDQSVTIRGVDLASGQALEIAPALHDSHSSYHGPAIDGNLIVYAEESSQNGGLYVYNLKTQTRTKIVDVAASYYAISGQRVAWTAGVVHVTDLSTGKDVTLPSALYSAMPDIDGERVAWSDSLPAKNRYRLAGYNLATGKMCSIHDSPNGDQLGPRITGMTIIWVSTDNGASNIALQSLPTDCR